MILGEILSVINIPPYSTEEIRYGLLPLKCGKLQLPKPTVILLDHNKENEIIIDDNFDETICVFPI